MKKRILSILLTICMLFCLTPISVFAEEVGAWGSAAIKLGADALNKTVNTEIAPTVYFGQNHENNPAAWRVIGYDGNGVTSAQGDITLLAAYNMGWSKFGSSAAYADSDLKTAIDALAEKLTSKETDAVQKQTLASGSYNRENTDCVSGTQVNNAVFWPLSTAEASAVNNDLRIADREHQYWASSYWWLRSPGAKNRDVASVDGFANIDHDGIDISNIWGVRPAFKLNLNSVLFASAAVGGKPDGGLTPIPEYSGNEWKLTLLDSSRSFAVTEKAVSAAPDDTVTLNYKWATTGINEYISVILADNNGAQYYGRVAQPTAESGTVEIKIPSDIAPGDYTLKVFNEQYNGDCKTDLASAFADVTLTVESQPDEQFTLAPSGRYYFDLSAMNIPGTVNSNLPDSTLHYVPFTYVGTVNAYKLTSEMATTEEYAQKNKYPHSLFIADYAVTHTVSWDDLNTAGLIFGKDYATGGVNYTLRAPSVGSDNRGSGDSERGTPQSNEWDRILDKDSGYIKNWNGIYSWGQDTTRYNSSLRAIRGYDSGRRWNDDDATDFLPLVSFRPVLEILNPDTLSSDGLKVVTLDLGGGTLGGSSENIQIIVKSSESFAAPASDGMTRPDGNTGSYFMWLGSNGKLYAPGASVPADVTKLTAQFVLSEQFSLTPGGRYYFDLSAMDIPGTVNTGNIFGATSLPDTTLHYVPFTYAGTVNAYKLTTEMATTEEYAQKNKYPHSLFVADYAVTNDVSWDALNTADLIFGKNYASGGVDYTLRTPSAGSDCTGLDDSQRGVPQSNEWDTMLNKDSGYIQNWNRMFSWGQDVSPGGASYRVVRGYFSARFLNDKLAANSFPYVGFRPVLEVLNPDTLGSDGLKVVTLDLGGGTLGNSSEDIQIIVKNGESFTAPATEGLSRPNSISEDAQLYWSDENGNCYKPGDTVPADVSMLSITGDYEVIYLPGTYGTGSAVTDMKPHNNILTLRGALFTRAGYTQVGWSTVDGGEKVYGFEDVYTQNEALTLYPVWNTNKYTITFDTNGGSEIAPITQDYGTEITAPANPTRKGYTFKGWDKEIPKTMPAENITVKAQWKINQYTITFDTNGGSDIAPITQDYGTEITAPDNPTRKGYTFKGWDKEIPETMPAENITITARWKDTEKPTGEIIIGTNKWNEFLNELTFGIFFKDTQEVTINAVDNSGVVFVSYLVTDKELSEAELNSLVFRAYEEPFCIEPNGEYIVYVMLVDENINITYLRSDRITLDNIQPVISGIENGKTYCEAQTVTVDEKYVDTVTVNGTAVTLDADGGFVLPPTNGEQKIVVTDKAGNNAEMTVTVNNGHTFGEWVSDNDGTHTRKCTVDGCDAFETENCSGGNATCTEKAVCDVCGKAYGEFDGTNHEGGVQEWTTRTAFNHEQKWNCCGAVIVASEAHEWKDGVCRECGYVCLHNDADKDHICDYCKKTISEHVDKDKNHICDYCEKTISEHVDKDKDHICDYCEKTISEHVDKDKNHVCDYCEKTISEHVDKDKDHICDYCKKTISAHEDAPTKEIKKADTVTAKLPDDSKSPQTGDNSNLILWIALLIISGGVMKGVTAFGKSKKHSAKIKDK
uniref:InlB B-repeat-containing protein n=1 Tax=Ruminococcus bromii TaxID=40518 RepID=UPI003FD7F1CB